MKISIILRGENPKAMNLKIRYTDKRDGAIINTGIVVPEVDFRDIHGKWVKQTHPNFATLNSNISDVLATVEKFCHEYFSKNNYTNPPANDVKKYFESLSKKTSDQTPEMIFRKFIHHLSHRDTKSISLGREAHYKATLNYLLEFDRDFIRGIEKEPIAFYYRFKEYLRKEQGNQENTINGHIARLKSFLFWAIDTGHTKLIRKKVEDFKTEWKDRDIIFHTDEEITALFKVDTSDSEYLTQVKDAYLIQCLIGLRHSDTDDSKWKLDLDNGSLKFLPKKTANYNKPVTIQLCNEAIELIRKYHDTGKQIPKFDNAPYNEAIKEIGSRAGLDEEVNMVLGRKKFNAGERVKKYMLMSSHVARATFICTLGKYQVPLSEIMRITGLSIGSINHYLEITDTRVKETLTSVYEKRGNLMA